jgi:hypothetical protein
LRARAVKNEKEVSPIIKLKSADAKNDRIASTGVVARRRPGLILIESAGQDVLENVQAIKRAEKEPAESKSDLAESARRLMKLRSKASKILPHGALVNVDGLGKLIM